MLEEKHGQVEAVAIEVDNALIITPIFKKEPIAQENEPLDVNTIKPIIEKRAPEGDAYG
jgi:hypothetical protein